MTYAEKAISDNWSRNILHNKTTAVSLYNCLSPQPSDCTVTPILGSSANLSDQQLGSHCWDWVYPLNRQIRTDIFIPAGCQETHDMATSGCHKPCQRVRLALGVGGTAGTEGLWPRHKSRGASCTRSSPVKTTRPKSRKRKPGVCKSIRAAQITHSQLWRAAFTLRPRRVRANSQRHWQRDDRDSIDSYWACESVWSLVFKHYPSATAHELHRWGCQNENNVTEASTKMA